MLTVITKPCPVCRRASSLSVDREAYSAWKRDTLVQIAFPTMSADDRELLISGTHPACGDQLMGPEEGEAGCP